MIRIVVALVIIATIFMHSPDRAPTSGLPDAKTLIGELESRVAAAASNNAVSSLGEVVLRRGLDGDRSGRTQAH